MSRQLRSLPILDAEPSGSFYGDTGIITDNGTVLDFGATSIDLSGLALSDRSLPKRLPIIDFQPAHVKSIKGDPLMMFAERLSRIKYTIRAGVPADVSILGFTRFSANSPTKTPTTVAQKVRQVSETSIAATLSLFHRLASLLSKKRRLARASALNWSRTPPISQLTMVLVCLTVMEDVAAVEAVLTADPMTICSDIRQAGFVNLLPRDTIDSFLLILQDKISVSGSAPSIYLVRALAHILHAAVSALEVNERDIKSVSDAVDARIRALFQIIPRVSETNLPLYAIRCGLMYGVVAVYESKQPQWKVGALNTTSDGFAGVAGVAGFVPDVLGIKLSQYVGAPVNGIAAGVIGRVEAKKKRLDKGLVHAERKFQLQVLGEADKGLVASYRSGASDHEPRPARGPFAADVMSDFKETAWEVFDAVIRDEDFETSVQRPTKLESQAQPFWGISWMAATAPQHRARITADTRRNQ